MIPEFDKEIDIPTYAETSKKERKRKAYSMPAPVCQIKEDLTFNLGDKLAFLEQVKS
jgi:hypothetical protein